VTEYSAGDVLLEESQEVTVTAEDGTVSYSEDLEDYATWEGGVDAELSVTVTDTATGETTTITYDKSLYLYRCPYGVVYSKTTGAPIAGAVVSVHDAHTGAVIALDLASNPTASNPQTTDASGRYDCKLEIGRQYYITVKATGFADYQSAVFSERWHVVREDIPLEMLRVVAQK
jgi:hypothetical protein